MTLNQDDNHGNIYLATIDSLASNSVLDAVVEQVSMGALTNPNYKTIYWNNNPKDTLFLDDFVIMEGRNIGCKNKVIEIVEYDKLWCSVLSKALQNEEKFNMFVKRCNRNVIGDENIFTICSQQLELYKGTEKLPHIPLFYIYSFTISLNFYMEPWQREALYMFDGYVFYDIQNHKIIHIVEEFDF